MQFVLGLSCCRWPFTVSLCFQVQLEIQEILVKLETLEIPVNYPNYEQFMINQKLFIIELLGEMYEKGKPDTATHEVERYLACQFHQFNNLKQYTFCDNTTQIESVSLEICRHLLINPSISTCCNERFHFALLQVQLETLEILVSNA